LQEPVHAEPAGNMQAILDALIADGELNGDGAYEPPALDRFVRALLARNYDTRDSSDFMKRIVRLRDEDELTWYYPLSARLSTRALALEETERKVQGGNEIIGGTLALGALAAHSYIKDPELITLNQSTAPSDSWLTLLPYEIAVDGRNGGLDISWEPSLALMFERLSLNLKVTPIEFNRYGGDEIWFSHLDAFITFRRHGFFSSVGIGPTYTYTWEEWPGHPRSNYGASAFVGLVQDKLRLTAGAMSFDENKFPGDRFYINFGITDVPGFLYWAASYF
jgi:hypothetical protein